MTLRPLFAYAPWQLRELLTRAFAPVAISVVVLGVPLLLLFGNATPESSMGESERAAFILQLFTNGVPLSCTLAAFLFMTESIASDRDKQHTRFLFSQPVAPALFYLQRYVLGLLLFVAMFAVVPLTFEWFLVDVPVLGVLAGMAVSLVLVGGLSVLCSAFTRRDGVLLILVYVTVRTLDSLREARVLPEWSDPFVRGLPPIPTMAAVTQALVAGSPVEWTEVVHVLGYGLGLLAAGLWVVRRAPLVR